MVLKEENLKDEFSALVLGFLGSFSNSIGFKSTNDSIFSGKEGEGSLWYDVKIEIYI